MMKDKKRNGMVGGAGSFFAAAVLVSLMTVTLTMPIVTHFSISKAEGVPVLTAGESPEMNLLPLRMQAPDFPDTEQSLDVRL